MECMDGMFSKNVDTVDWALFVSTSQFPSLSRHASLHNQQMLIREENRTHDPQGYSAAGNDLISSVHQHGACYFTPSW